MSSRTWRQEASAVIYAATKNLPDDLSLKDRMRIVDDAYPFGVRKYYPYKAWLKARKSYLSIHGYRPASKSLIETPLERMMRRGSK